MGLRPTNPASSRSNTITEQLHEYSEECNYVSQLSSTKTTAAAAARHTSSCSSQEQEQGAQEAQEALSKTRVTTTKLLSSAASSEPGDPKRRKISQQKRTVLVSVVAGNGTRSSSEDVPADLWAWRKYGQKPIKGSPYPRGYYRCSSSKGCLARKQVERSHSDPSMLIISYSAEHNHPWPSHRNSLAGSTRVTSSASKLAKGESAADQVACTRSSAATLEKQESSLSMITQLKSESEEHEALIPCHDHSVEEEEVPAQEEKENFANGPSADEESKANPVVTVPSYKLQQQSAAITSSGFSTTSVSTHYGAAGSCPPAAGFKQVEPVLNVQVSSGQVQIAVQSYAESSCDDHVDMLDSLYSSSSMEPSMDEDFFTELEELIPDSSMATFGWSRRSCFFEDQSDDEGVVGSTAVVDPYNLFCWSTTSSVESKAVI
jgi:hypothetical protein